MPGFAIGSPCESPFPSAYFRLLPSYAQSDLRLLLYFTLKCARLAFGCASHYITGPMIQGANSSSPTPDSSLLLCLPDATATISSKICRPTSGSGVPSRITPQLMSMSSDMWRYIRLLVASLIDGTGLQPNTEPRPVVKQIMLQPPATRPVIDTGSCPGVSMNTKPRVVIGSPYWKTSIIGVVPPLVTPPRAFSNTVVIPPALLPGAGLLSMASMPRQYHSHHLYRSICFLATPSLTARRIKRCSAPKISGASRAR